MPDATGDHGPVPVLESAGASRRRMNWRTVTGRSLIALTPWVVVLAVLVAAPLKLRVAKGGSMAPAVMPGDVCVVREGGRRVRRGDVVLFEKDGWPGGVLHRVTARQADGSVRTRGDANPVADLDPVQRGDIVGRCVFVLPTGRAAYFLGTLDWW